MTDSKHTPGPWRWEVNLHAKTVSLYGGTPTFDKMVMTFKRWGMRGAQPVFWDWSGGNFGVPELASSFEGREHHASWLSDINHPDARLIAAAPELLDALEELLAHAAFIGIAPHYDQLARSAIAKARGE